MTFIQHTRLVALALLFTAGFASASVAECPLGTSFVGIVSQTETERTSACQCDSVHVGRNNQCVLRMPAIDPAFFVSPEHAAFIDGELGILRARKARFEDQLAKLNRLRDQQGEYLAQMGEMREQVIYDAVGDILGLLSAKGIVDKIPGLSPADAAELARGTQALKAAIEGVASAQAGADRSRARAKALSAAGTTLNLIAKLTIPEKYKDAIAKTVKASTELVKTADTVQATRGKEMRERTGKVVDNLLGVVGAVYQPVGIARASINAAGGVYVAWRITADKEAIVEALVSSQRAKLAFDQRLAATNDLIKFYDVELKKGQM